MIKTYGIGARVQGSYFDRNAKGRIVRTAECYGKEIIWGVEYDNLPGVVQNENQKDLKLI